MTKDEALKMAGYELDGVIADVENFDGFDDVCLQTIKRVRSTIAEALEQPAQENRFNSALAVATVPRTHPHQWQGLTDDDITKAVLEIPVTFPSIFGIARAIEQALKEKNHD